MNKSTKIVLGTISGIVTATIIALFVSLDVTTIKGNEYGVKETWAGGVEDNVYQPKTYFLFPAWSQKIYKYDGSQQVFVLNNDDSKEEFGEGRKGDAYIVQSKDQQDMTISARVKWRINPEKLVNLHKMIQSNVEERVLRPTVLRIIKNEATVVTALDAYSGEGLVNLQKSILDEMQKSEELNNYIIIDEFTIERIALDKKYTEQIVARQIAIQERLRNIEQAKAAVEAAEKAKAEAQADYEKTIVAAKRDKEQGILEAEKLAQQKVLEAKADAERVALTAKAERDRNVLIAEGEQEAAKSRAEAILAIGKAEAEAKKLQMLAYSAQGGEIYARIETAKSMAQAYQGIKGYLPEKMNVSVLSKEFQGGLNILAPIPAAETK